MDLMLIMAVQICFDLQVTLQLGSLFGIMAERKPWTEEQDRLLKFVFESSKLTKWSAIARRLAEQFGVKGRNGKHCKERYTTHIDTSFPKEDWSLEEEQRMFELHNELGNKWAVIGSRLGGKTDNEVKNHFYSILRKALRKINRVIVDELKKQLKQIKPNVLYRIVEVSEQRFKLTPCFQKQFVCYSNDLKNELLEFSYDGEDSGSDEEDNVNVEVAKRMIDKIAEFGFRYKKRAKRQRRASGQQKDLLTPMRYYKGSKPHSENEESEHSSSFVNSSDMGNLDDISEDDDILRIEKSKRVRRNSAAQTAGDNLQLPRVRTRANSQDNLKNNIAEPIKDQEIQKIENTAVIQQNNQLQVEGILEGLKIMELDDNLPPHPMMMKKETSKYSRYSQGLIEREEYHFFEDSQIEMRILPQMDLGLRRESQLQQRFFE